MSNITPESSWGHYPKHTPATQRALYWAADLHSLPPNTLARGFGRSYGDVCQIENGHLLEINKLNKFISFDSKTGILEAEAGVSLQEIIELALPQGWFLPVTPGTKFVTLGGCIANDVHGKNHHVSGSFGHFIKHLSLYRSDQGVCVCSPETRRDLFVNTVGGLGLTGIILSAQIQLIPVVSDKIEVENFSFRNLTEFVQLTKEAEKKYPYVVAWVDTASSAQTVGRGILMMGRHLETSQNQLKSISFRQKLSIPYLPNALLSMPILSLMSSVYWHKSKKNGTGMAGLDSFFYPLDSLKNWNRAYGHRGFLQYQFVVPGTPLGFEVTEKIIKLVGQSKHRSFLSVLKLFGQKESLGAMSFPRPGLTLTLDFANSGPSLFKLLDTFDQLVLSAKGRVYPAKDARMSPEVFKAGFPNYREWLKFKDPQLNSSFLNRVLEDKKRD